MDTIASSSNQAALKQEVPELIYLFGSTELNGLTYGSALTVPEGYSALAVIGDKPFDTVGPGEYLIDGTYFPQLAKSLRIQSGAAPAKPVKLAVYFVNVTAAALSWRALPTVTRNKQYGLTYCDLRGNCTVRVANPAAFYSAFKTGLARLLKKEPAATRPQLAAATPGQQAEMLVRRTISSAAGIGLEQMKLAPEQVAGSAVTMQQMVGATSAAALQAMGLECTGFDITVQPESQRAMLEMRIAHCTYGLWRLPPYYQPDLYPVRRETRR